MYYVAKGQGSREEHSLKGFSYAWSPSGFPTFVYFRLFLLTVPIGRLPIDFAELLKGVANDA